MLDLTIKELADIPDHIGNVIRDSIGGFFTNLRHDIANFGGELARAFDLPKLAVVENTVVQKLCSFEHAARTALQAPLEELNKLQNCAKDFVNQLG